MKKNLSKLFAMALALIMVMALTVPAMAAAPAETGSITVNNAVNEKTYIIYRIFDLKQVAGSGTTEATAKVSYTIADKWTGFFAAGEDGAQYIVADQGSLTNQIVVDGVTKWINITEANVAEFAQDALAYALENSTANDGEKAADGSTVTFSGLALGYYMVYPKGATDIKDNLGSICSLTSTIPSATVVPKADYPTVDKEVDDANVQFGQVVTYTITGQVPDTTGYVAGSYTYKIKDTMNGLTLNGKYSVTIGGDYVLVDNINTPAVDKSALITGTVPTDGASSFEMGITVDGEDMQTNHVGESIVIKYQAVVSETATIGPNGNKNSAQPIYSNDPDQTENGTPVEVKVYTCEIDIVKVDGADSNKKLSGAEFALMNSDGKYYKLTNGVVSWETIAGATYENIVANATTVTTDENGAAEFKGIEAGSYQLVEIKAPQGYNLLTTPEEVTIASDGDQAYVTATATVENNTGSVLPSTGGMGTTLFYTIGGVLVVAAGVLLVTKKRMNNMEG